MRRLVRFQFSAAFAEFPWRFLLALGTGILLAILTMAHFLSVALGTFRPTSGLFFGLVLASVFVVRRRVGRWTAGAVATLALFAVLMFLLVGGAG